jgi:hypothetical protein
VSRRRLQSGAGGWHIWNIARVDPYIAILLFESTVDSPGEPPLYREDIALLHAESLETARAAARAHGEGGATSYLNAAGQRVTCALKHVVDVNRLLYDDLDGDVDLYSRHFRGYDEYRRFEPRLSGENRSDEETALSRNRAARECRSCRTGGAGYLAFSPTQLIRPRSFSPTCSIGCAAPSCCRRV